MKAISTRYLSATLTRPARIKAFDLDGNAVTITHPGGLGVMPYALAARALCARMHWEGVLVAGAVKGGYVFTWLDDETSMRITTDGSATLPGRRV